MKKNLFFLFAFTFFCTALFAQKLQGSLRFGASNQDIIIVVKNNGATPYIGNLTSFEVTVRLEVPDYKAKNMKYMFSDDPVTYSLFRSFQLPIYGFYWSGNHAFNLAPGETFDLFGFQIGGYQSPTGGSEIPPAIGGLLAGDAMSHPWTVKLDGVEIADQNTRFFDSGIPYRSFYNDSYGSILTIEAEPVLPVRLAEFKTHSDENVAVLNWATTEEMNSSKFEIQHSTDSETWKTIGSVAASGESSAMKYYSFSHSAVSPGNNYYRLKMIDLDLTYSYSRIEVVDMPFRANAIYPNPATSEFTLQNLDTRNISVVKIYNAFGKLVSQSNPVKELIYIEHFSPGTYIAVIHKLDGSSTSHKFVKK
jgi:hypothetical protein